MEKTFTNLGKLTIGDWERGLLMAVIGAVLTVLYESFAKGVPSTWVQLHPILQSAVGIGITAGIAYILKNLGTGAGGKLLTNAPPSPQPEKK